MNKNKIENKSNSIEVSVAISEKKLESQIKKSRIIRSLYIIVMDDNNYNNVKSLASNKLQEDKIKKMTDFLIQYKNHDEIPDPYYGGATGFELVLDLLEDACEGLMHKIINS
jgi:protein-tyrosine phosphatase